MINGFTVRRSSWMALGSEITQNCLVDLRKAHPQIPSNTLLYLEPTRENNIAWHFDGGRFAATFYGDSSIRMRFAGDGRPVPTEAMLQTGKVILLKYIDKHFYDVTERRRLEKLDRWSYRILEHWRKGSARYGNRDYQLEGSPSLPGADNVVFPFELGLQQSGRDTLVMVPGGTYSHPLPEITAGSQLRLGVALASASSDGIFATVKVTGPHGERTVYSRQLEASGSVSDYPWDDRVIDLDEQGAGYCLRLEAQLLPGRTSARNWLEWSPLEVVPPAAQKLVLPEATIPPQPIGIRIFPSPIRRGETVTVEVIGGEEMEVDCLYTLDAKRPPQTLVSWLTSDRQGRQSFVVNTPGRYIFTAIRNGLRSDWVPIHYEWICLP